MKKARMNISHSRFILSKLKIFGEIVTTFFLFYDLPTCYEKAESLRLATTHRSHSPSTQPVNHVFARLISIARFKSISFY